MDRGRLQIAYAVEMSNGSVNMLSYSYTQLIELTSLGGRTAVPSIVGHEQVSAGSGVDCRTLVRNAGPTIYWD